MKWNIGKTIRSSNKSEIHQQIKQYLLESRGLTDSADQADFFKPPHPKSLILNQLGIEQEALKKAALRLIEAKNKSESVIIYGDYDADGITATAVLWLLLKKIGLIAQPFIPLREVHGYGLSEAGISEIMSKYKPDLVVTVDNGIVAHQPVKLLKDKQIDVIITDHHQPDEQLPEADILVHSDQISGAGVSWLLANEIASQAGLDQMDVDELLDLAGIGTISDLMPMIGPSRSFAWHGLKALSDSNRPGIQALKSAAGIEPGTEMTTYHVGFVLGPRINAMGRIGDGADALRLLCTSHLERANSLAVELDTTNDSRRDMTQTAVDMAIEMYESSQDLQSGHIIVLGHEDYHEGIIGLIAGKLVEKYYKPAIVLSLGEETAKGSARSIKGVNIIELIRQTEFLLKGVGGHPGAAGLSIEIDKIETFTAQITQLATEQIAADQLVPSVDIDCQIPLSVVDLDLYEEIQTFAPFGIGNHRPMFSSEVEFVDFRLVGREKTHLKFTVVDPETNMSIDGIGFGKADLLPQIEANPQQQIAYRIDRNEWNGRVSVQIVLNNLNES